MRYISLFSGIEAATVAWKPLGWTPLWFSEIESFPAAILAERFPNIPNLGDIKNHETWPQANPDLIVGGSPCQGFSIAGLRHGLGDHRSNLMWQYLDCVSYYQPRWVIWENVPGVLSSDGGRDFGAFLGALAELRYGFAYRVLDAQYIRTQRFRRAVPQRRRRVFVVGYLGNWRRPAAILFDAASGRGNPPPRRETGKEAPTIPARSTGGGGLGTDFDLNGGLVAQCLTGQMSKGLNSECNDQPLIAYTSRGEGFDASEDGTGRGTPLVTFFCKDYGADCSPETSPTLRAMTHDASHANAGGQIAVAGKHRVRRLTPTECERLMGFPDDYTRIPWRNKSPDKCPDGPRYKALGNSMAVNCMEWIGRRIQVEEMLR